MSQSIHVSCPICGKEVAWNAQHRWRPFCSKRCQLIDFGGWAEETYCISDAANDIDSELSDDDLLTD